jgi:hypothetical protein
MKFACPNPNCDNGVGFGDRRCSKCNFELSFGSLWKLYTGRLIDGLRRSAVTKCPYSACGAIIPITSKECPICKKPLTVSAAFVPAQERILRLAQKRDPKVLRRIQLVYFFLSGAVLFGLICYLENKSKDELFEQAGMSAVYLVIIVILIRLFVRADKIRIVLRHVSPLVRFTLLINYLSVLVVLQVCIGTWWKKASILAGLFGTTFVAIYLISALWPLAVAPVTWFAEPQEEDFNPSSAQGRSFRTDNRAR